MEIKIIPIRMGFDTVYVVSGDGTIVVDSGDPNKIANFRKGLQEASIKPNQIQLIVLTHGHWDHIGSAKDIKDLTGAKVLLHQKDMHFLEETVPSQPHGFTPWGKFVIGVIKLATQRVRIPAFEVDIVAGDHEISLVDYGIPGKVVPTPGHSWGSVSVVLDSGEAFVGDLGANMIPMQTKPGLPIFGDDIEVVKNSWKKLRGLGVKIVFPAHGKAFPINHLDQILNE